MSTRIVHFYPCAKLETQIQRGEKKIKGGDQGYTSAPHFVRLPSKRLYYECRE